MSILSNTIEYKVLLDECYSSKCAGALRSEGKYWTSTDSKGKSKLHLDITFIAPYKLSIVDGRPLKTAFYIDSLEDRNNVTEMFACNFKDAKGQCKSYSFDSPIDQVQKNSLDPRTENILWTVDKTY